MLVETLIHLIFSIIINIVLGIVFGIIFNTIWLCIKKLYTKKNIKCVNLSNIIIFFKVFFNKLLRISKYKKNLNKKK